VTETSPQGNESATYTPPDPWAEADKWFIRDWQIGETHQWSAYFLRRFDNVLKIVATVAGLAAASAALATATSRTTVGLLALVGGLSAGTATALQLDHRAKAFESAANQWLGLRDQWYKVRLAADREQARHAVVQLLGRREQLRSGAPPTNWFAQRLGHWTVRHDQRRGNVTG